MENTIATKEIRNILQQFQNGYKERDIDKLDEFVSLFVQKDDIELIGIGAFERGRLSGLKE